MTGSTLTRISTPVRVLLVIWIWLGLGVLPARAQGVVAEVSPPEVSVGQSLRYTLTFEGLERIKYDPPAFPEGLEMLGQSQSQQFSMINGRTTSTVTLLFKLRALKIGVYKIPGVQVVARQGKFQSEALEVTVSRPTARPKGNKQEEGPLFLEVVVTPKAVYMGEPMALGSRVYLKEGYQHSRPPQGLEGRFEGFRVDQMEVNNQSGTWINRPEGRFTEFDVDRKILVPLKAGEFTLLPGGAHVTVMRKGAGLGGRHRGFMSSFFDPPSQQLQLEADAQFVKVFRVPDQGRPPDYSGLVGRRMSLKVVVDARETKVGSPLHLKVKLKGRADLRGLKEIPVDFPSSLTVFETKGKREIKWRAEGPVSTAIFESVLVPNRPGKIKIPDLELSYFDAEKGSFQRLIASGPTLQVTGEAPRQAAVPSAASQVVQEPSVEAGDNLRVLRFLREEAGPFRTRRAPLHERREALAWLAGLFLLGAGAEAWGRHRERFAGDAVGLRASLAYRNARAELGGLKAKKAGREFYGELTATLREYVAARCRRETAGLRAEELLELLGERGIAPELLQQGQDLLERVEAQRYAPVSHGAPERDLVLVSSWIEKVEGSLS
jgi:hypothetical protein